MSKFNVKTLLCLFICLFGIKGTAAFAARNCSYEDASIYFSSPSVVIGEYLNDYYCTDIAYLIRNKLGNISLLKYAELYPKEMRDNLSSLRKMGITPDIVYEYIDVDSFDDFKTPEGAEEYMNGLISSARINNQYWVSNFDKKSKKNTFDLDKDEKILAAYSLGTIINENKNFKACSNTTEEEYEIENSMYSSNKPSYTKLIATLPSALRPVAMSDGKLLNAFGQEVAQINDNRALGKGTRRVVFSDYLFEQKQSATIGWNESVCKANTIQEIVDRNSTCYLCSFIVMIFNETSYLFEYMYNKFRDIIVIFLIVFCALFMAYEFLKGFSNLPFDTDFSNYPKSIAKKLQLILIVCTIILVPPRYLFSWTIEPVMNLTIAISSTILQVGNTEQTKNVCNGNSVVDELNEKRKLAQDEQVTPPVVKKRQIENVKQLENSVIISKTTMGNIICFLTNTLEANGRQMTMGEILMRDLFNFKSKSKHKFLGFIFGVVIFALYFSISLMISFYILDGLLQFLKLAIIWPFYIFGYAFPFIGYNVKSIIDTAKQFGLIMINLAIFSTFNSALLNGFYFSNSKENILQILNKAIEANDTSIIIDNIPTDLLSISKFLFIIYCIYYVYSKLSEFAASYGGNAGNLVVGKSIQKIINTTRKLSVLPDKKIFTKRDGKNKNNNTETTEQTEETTEVQPANE